MRSTDMPIPTQLTVVAWPDPVVDALGFLPHDPYSELVWTPTLGPSAILAWRRMAGTLIHRPDGYSLDVADFAHALGLGAGTAHHAPVCRTLRRLAVFDLAGSFRPRPGSSESARGTTTALGAGKGVARRGAGKRAQRSREGPLPTGTQPWNCG